MSGLARGSVVRLRRSQAAAMPLEGGSATPTAQATTSPSPSTGTGAPGRCSPTPNPAGAGITGLFGISCPAPAGCTAVGSSREGTLAEYWNGSTWAIQATPSRPARTSSSESPAPFRGTCPAVGQRGKWPLAERD